jgi:hypothetical protein
MSPAPLADLALRIALAWSDFVVALDRRGMPKNGQLADLLGAGSNHLADMLKEWNTILKHSTLGCAQPQNTNERKDGCAPRGSRPAAVRRRKIA